jgi:hypothetical protein
MVVLVVVVVAVVVEEKDHTFFTSFSFQIHVYKITNMR